MNKKIVRASSIIAVGVLLALTTSETSSASIAGTKCTKVGQSKTVAKLKFTCIKSGQKLIWNKGVVVKTPSNTSTSTTTSTATNLEVKPTPEPSKPTAPAMPYSGYTEIEREVFLGMDKLVQSWQPYLSALTNKNVTLITENSSHPRNEPNRLGVEISYSIIKDMQPKMIAPVYYTYETSAWIDNQIKDSCRMLVGNNKTGLYAGAQVGCGKLVTANLTGWNNVKGNDSNSWFEAAHETFHIAQYRAAIVGNDENNSAWYPKVPAWYREGSASTFAALVRILMSKGEINYSELNDFEKSPYTYAECKNAWDFWNQSNDATGFSGLGQCEYGLGRRMTDYVAGKHGGISGILKTYEYLAQGKNFDEAFKLAHNIELKDFFKEVTLFLAPQGFVITS